jgi:hypothetical protein
VRKGAHERVEHFAQGVGVSDDELRHFQPQESHAGKTARAAASKAVAGFLLLHPASWKNSLLPPS